MDGVEPGARACPDLPDHLAALDVAGLLCRIDAPVNEALFDRYGVRRFR